MLPLKRRSVAQANAAMMASRACACVACVAACCSDDRIWSMCVRMPVAVAHGGLDNYPLLWPKHTHWHSVCVYACVCMLVTITHEVTIRVSVCMLMTIME